jgi:hypothetical protein
MRTSLLVRHLKASLDACSPERNAKAAASKKKGDK